MSHNENLPTPESITPRVHRVLTETENRFVRFIGQFVDEPTYSPIANGPANADTLKDRSEGCLLPTAVTVGSKVHIGAIADGKGDTVSAQYRSYNAAYSHVAFEDDPRFVWGITFDEVNGFRAVGTTSVSARSIDVRAMSESQAQQAVDGLIAASESGKLS